MGHGTFDYAASATRAAVRDATGTTAFAYSTAAAVGKVAKLHESLDVRLKARREARDNDDNPFSVPIAMICDVTGSMRGIPEYLIKDASRLMKAILEQKVIEYPQILFGAVGDATCDDVPFAIGEFEADDEKAEGHLSNIFLEGRGGGQDMESYELVLWYFATQVDTDAWEKRGEKGYLFIIGDEAPYPTVQPHLVRQWLGLDIQEEISLAEVARQCQEKWHVFILRPGGTSCFSSKRVRDVWTSVIPEERVLQIEKWQEIVPFIAGTTTVMAGTSLDDLDAVLDTGGFDATTRANVKDALVPLANSVVSDAMDTVDNGRELVGAGGGTGERL